MTKKKKTKAKSAKKRRSTTLKADGYLQVGIKLHDEQHAVLQEIMTLLREHTGKHPFLAEVARAAMIRGLGPLHADIKKLVKKAPEP